MNGAWEQRRFDFSHMDMSDSAARDELNTEVVEAAQDEVPAGLRSVPLSTLRDLGLLSISAQGALRRLGLGTPLERAVTAVKLAAEKFPVDRWLAGELNAAIAWLVQNGSTSIFEFLDEEDRRRARALLHDPRHPSTDDSEAFVSSAMALARRVLEKPLLEALSEWRVGKLKLLKHITALIPLFERLSNGQSASISEEISLPMEGLSERDRRFVIRYLGLDGAPGETLEELGAAAGVTRERVRQIVQRFQNRAAAMCLPMPLCEAVVESLGGTLGPVSLREWWGRIPEQVRPSIPEELRAIQTFEKWGWLSRNTWFAGENTVFAARGEGHKEQARETMRHARGPLSDARSFGAASVTQLALLLQQPARFVQSILLSDQRWQRFDDEWFVFSQGFGHLNLKIVEKMLGVLGPLSVDHVRAGLKRYRGARGRKRSDPPPRSVFRSVLQLSGYVISNDDLIRPKGSARCGLSPGEVALVQVLSDGQAVVTLHEAAAGVRSYGFSEALAKYLLSYSPLVARLVYGLYALRGRRVSRFDIQAAELRLEKQSSGALVSQHFVDDGSIRIEYRLPVDREVQTFYVRPGMIPEGVWNLMTSGTNIRRIMVRPSYLTGLHQVARQALKEGATGLRLSFDVRRREVDLLVLEPLR